MNPDKEILIITLNYNNEIDTLNSIKSVLKSSFKDFKVLIVDNGSDEEKYQKLKNEIIKINDSRVVINRIEKNAGYVGGINAALTSTHVNSSNYIMIMNNDTIIDSNAVFYLYNICKRYKDKAIVSGKVYWFDKPNIIQNTGMLFSKFNISKPPIGLNEKDIGQHDGVFERDMLDDIFWIFKKDLIDQIGIYSDYFWFNAEQADFAMRAKKYNYKLIYSSDAKIWHKSGATIGGRTNNPVKTYFGIQSRLIYSYRNFNFFIFIIEYFKVCAKFFKSFFMLLLFRENIKRTLAIFFGFIYFYKWIIKRNENIGEIPQSITK